MPANASDISAAIPAGTFAQGDRQDFSANLQTALGRQGEGAQPGGGQAPPPVDSVTDPIAALVGGELDPGGSGALTDGLSVGPGTGVDDFQPQLDPRRVRLMQIATQSTSVILRSSARIELRLLDDELL